MEHLLFYLHKYMCVCKIFVARKEMESNCANVSLKSLHIKIINVFTSKCI